MKIVEDIFMFIREGWKRSKMRAWLKTWRVIEGHKIEEVSSHGVKGSIHGRYISLQVGGC